MLNNLEDVHISKIKAGDLVVHEGVLKTVCSKDIRTGGFLGTTLWGDSYRAGTLLVKRVVQ